VSPPGDVRETHAWYDGEGWHLYTERRADARKFERWLGPPTRRGRGGECAAWDGIPPDVLSIRRKPRRGSKSTSPKAVSALQRWNAARSAPPSGGRALGGASGR
jgi:hypothetical protein